MGSDNKPWELRDRFRLAAVDLNPMFITREDSEFTFEQVRQLAQSDRAWPEGFGGLGGGSRCWRRGGAHPFL